MYDVQGRLLAGNKDMFILSMQDEKTVLPIASQVWIGPFSSALISHHMKDMFPHATSLPRMILKYQYE
jgi:hypothetical protein